MAEGHSESVFRSLESGFEATLAHEDEMAANDLALSLIQGRSLRESLARNGSLIVATGPGQWLPVHTIGDDFLAAEMRLFLLERAVVRASAGEGPRVVSETLVRFLRRRLRLGLCECVVTCGDRVLQGRLAVVGPDYLAVEGLTGRSFVPLRVLTEIRFPDGLEDAF